jgi:hypothetical protein
MKNIPEKLSPLSTLEHLIPFLLILSLLNGYLVRNTGPLWTLLRTNGVDSLTVVMLIISSLIAINFLCALGYALSRLCVLAFGLTFRRLRDS